MKATRLLVVLLTIVVLSAAVKPAAARPAAGVPILVYHHVDTKHGYWYVPTQNFAAQVAYLHDNGYHTITMAQYLDIVQSGATPPDKQVVITFDDGYSDSFAVVFPLLKQYGMIGTFFIITGRVGTDGYMTWGQIAEMQRAGMEIGAHTVNHPFLTKLPYIQAYLEMRQSKLDLEQRLHTPISIFAYPYNDHNRMVTWLARMAGFRAALAVSPHKGDLRGDYFTIHRLTVSSGEGIKTFEMAVQSYDVLFGKNNALGHYTVP